MRPQSREFQSCGTWKETSAPGFSVQPVCPEVEPGEAAGQIVWSVALTRVIVRVGAAASAPPAAIPATARMTIARKVATAVSLGIRKRLRPLSRAKKHLGTDKDLKPKFCR